MRPAVVFRWNRWAALQGIQLAEGGIAPIKSLIRQPANPPERMAGRDPLLVRDVGEQGGVALLLASHQRLGSCPILAEGAGFFSKLLDSKAPQYDVVIWKDFFQISILLGPIVCGFLN